MRTYILIIVILIFNQIGHSQPDSTENYLSIDNVTRSKKLLSVNYYRMSPYTLKNSENLTLNGVELNNSQGYSIHGMLPIYVSKKGHLRITVNYDYLRMSFNNSSDAIYDSVTLNHNSDYYTTNRYTITPTMMLNYKLGKRTVVHMLNVSMNSYDFFKPSYYSAMLLSNVVLKQSPKKSSSIGLMIIYSDNFNFPVIPLPIYTYNTYINPKWTYEMTLPFSIGIRRIQNNKLNILGSAKLDALSSLFKPQYYNDVARFSDVGLAIGIKAEYKIIKYIRWQADIQYKYSFGTKIIDNDSADNMIDFDANSKFIFQTGLSFSF